MDSKKLKKIKLPLFLEIPGKPIAKKRPRFVIMEKGLRSYSAQSTEEGDVMLRIMQKTSSFEFASQPIAIDFMFVFKRPKSHYRTGSFSHLLKDSSPAFHLKTPDVDNLVKFYMDCMNSVVYHDDSIVVKVNALKRFTTCNEEYPFTTITIKEFNESLLERFIRKIYSLKKQITIQE